jgi:hypothetical protein
VGVHDAVRIGTRRVDDAVDPGAGAIHDMRRLVQGRAVGADRDEVGGRDLVVVEVDGLMRRPAQTFAAARSTSA